MKQFTTRRKIIAAVAAMVILLVVAVGLLVAAVGLVIVSDPVGRGILMMGLSNSLKAGTWRDDPKNWSRAFGQAPPESVSVVHSYYWKSAHFTDEFIYFFEVKASTEWFDAFVKECKAEPVAPENARRFEFHYDETPNWFVTESVGNYDVWDSHGNHGSIWVNKRNGHIYFYGVQL